ncbi:MAG: ATP-binding protein [Clostridia bacterium]|nr:ATP-binding protein [Clostridia bacterium]
MDITKIVITGGPCAGKTTALSRIRNYFSKMGYTVLIVPETATELISGGVAPWTCKTNLEYQLCHMRLQLEKEAVFVRAASTMEGKKALIVCDRGVTDCKAYMTARDFEAAAEALGADEVDLRDGYDAVFHLVTAAKGAEEFYTLSNNEARTETLEQARELSKIAHPLPRSQFLQPLPT